MTKCQGSDCVGQSKPMTESLRFCNRCSKPVCGWCQVHCNPTHQCVTDEEVRSEIERYRKELCDDRQA